MTIYFAGSEQVILDNATGTEYNGAFDTNFTRASMAAYGQHRISFPTAVPGSSSKGVWIHYRGVSWDYDRVDSSPLSIYDSNNNEIIRFSSMANNYGTLVFSIDGAAVSQSTSYYDNDHPSLDLMLRQIGSDSVFRLYRDGNSVCELTLTGKTLPDIAAIRVGGSVGYSPVAISELIVADVCTIGLRVGTFYPNGNGVYTEQVSGNYSSIDESVTTETDAVVFDLTGQRYSCTLGKQGSQPMTPVLAIATHAQAVGSLSIQPGLRIGETDYYADAQAVGESLTRVSHIWNASPDGGSMPQTLQSLELIWRTA